MNGSRSATAAGLLAEGIVIVGLLVSIVRPNRRLWPPGEHRWKFGLFWCCGAVVAASAAVVGYLGRRSPDDGSSWRLPFGGLLAGSGLAISGRATRDLRVAETLGLEGRLHTDGLYRYTRNPQYVGYLVAICGLTLLVNSIRFTVLAAGSVVWLLLLPFAEEPWLAEQYGESYETYRERVPRFVADGRAVRAAVTSRDRFVRRSVTVAARRPAPRPSPR